MRNADRAEIAGRIVGGFGLWLCAAVLCWFVAEPAVGQEADRIGIHRVGPEILMKVQTPAGTGFIWRSEDLKEWAPWHAFIKPEGVMDVGLVEDRGHGFFRLGMVGFDVPPELVWIPPGMFHMGSPDTEQHYQVDELLHRVRIHRGFWMARHEVTASSFFAVMGFNPSRGATDSHSDRPVDNVSWEEAVEYCQRVTERDRADNRIPPGTEYRLPTEAEWEYAARAGTTTRFFYGDDPDYTELANWGWHGDSAGGRTQRVGLLPPNPWGLHDIIGNVFEWCLDYYGAYPGGRIRGSEKNHVYRGGSYYCPDWVLRSAERHPGGDVRSSLIGFRVVLGGTPDTINVPVEVAALTSELLWNADQTSVTLSASTVTEGATIRYAKGFYTPTESYGDTSGVATSEPTTLKARAFRRDWLASPMLTVEIRQAAPPRIQLQGALVVLEGETPYDREEFRIGDGPWEWYTDPIGLNAGERIQARCRRQGLLTSLVVEWTQADR